MVAPSPPIHAPDIAGLAEAPRIPDAEPGIYRGGIPGDEPGMSGSDDAGLGISPGYRGVAFSPFSPLTGPSVPTQPLTTQGKWARWLTRLRIYLMKRKYVWEAIYERFETETPEVNPSEEYWGKVLQRNKDKVVGLGNAKIRHALAAAIEALSAIGAGILDAINGTLVLFRDCVVGWKHLLRILTRIRVNYAKAAHKATGTAAGSPAVHAANILANQRLREVERLARQNGIFRN